jgi:hypothetical protein
MGRIRKEWMRKRRVMVKTICSRRVISREVGGVEGVEMVKGEGVGGGERSEGMMEEGGCGLGK